MAIHSRGQDRKRILPVDTPFAKASGRPCPTARRHRHGIRGISGSPKTLFYRSRHPIIHQGVRNRRGEDAPQGGVRGAPRGSAAGLEYGFARLYEFLLSCPRLYGVTRTRTAQKQKASAPQGAVFNSPPVKCLVAGHIRKVPRHAARRVRTRGRPESTPADKAFRLIAGNRSGSILKSRVPFSSVLPISGEIHGTSLCFATGNAVGACRHAFGTA